MMVARVTPVHPTACVKSVGEVSDYLLTNHLAKLANQPGIMQEQSFSGARVASPTKIR